MWESSDPKSFQSKPETVRIFTVPHPHLIFALVLPLGPLHIQHQDPGAAAELQWDAFIDPGHHLTAEQTNTEEAASVTAQPQRRTTFSEGTLRRNAEHTRVYFKTPRQSGGEMCVNMCVCVNVSVCVYVFRLRVNNNRRTPVMLGSLKMSSNLT